MRARLSIAIALCAVGARGWDLTLVHVNDIHSHLEPVEVQLPLEPPIAVRAGGGARLVASLRELRAEHPDAVFLHAGDQLVGTPWSSVYDGLVDAAVLDRMGLDAFVPGNHEFDRGSAPLRRFLDSLHVPAVAANLDVSRDSSLRGHVRSCAVVRRGSRLVGIVGVAQPGTPSMSSPGPDLRFHAASSVRRTVDSLRRAGISTVLLLSHAGFETDTVLARTVPGICAVVGGHSHTRMGRSLTDLGLRTDLPYPYVVRGPGGLPVPVVQAWEWGEEIGEISLHLDDSGRTTGWDAMPFLPLSDTILRGGRPLSADSSRAVRARLSATGAVRFFAPDPAVQTMLSAWAGPIEALRRTVVARIPVALHRNDPALAELCAKALREAGSAWGAQVGLQNGGGVRESLPAGEATAETVRRIMPFQNTVVVIALRGFQLRALHRSLSERKGAPAGWDGILEGADGSLGLSATGRPLLDSDTVRIATNSYLASGKDGCRALAKSDGFRLDTGIEDAQALSALLARINPPVVGTKPPNLSPSSYEPGP